MCSTSFLAASRAVRLLEASGFSATLSSGFLAVEFFSVSMKIICTCKNSTHNNNQSSESFLGPRLDDCFSAQYN